MCPTLGGYWGLDKDDYGYPLYLNRDRVRMIDMSSFSQHEALGQRGVSYHLKKNRI